MILITGANGQLATSLKKFLPVNKAKFFTSKDLDITNQVQCKKALEDFAFTGIINCAAYTNVDGAESNKDQAFAVNCSGVGNLAELSSQFKIPFIHISTDYVFDGAANKPYVETDSTDPINLYGLSKLAGEKEVLQHAQTAIIIRTSWLYSLSNNTFLSKMLSLFDKKQELKIICDQIGTPTFSDDLAQTILSILPQIQLGMKEIFHYSNEGVASWYDFAFMIAKLSGMEADITQLAPLNIQLLLSVLLTQVLNKTKIKEVFGVEIKHWVTSLECCLSLK